ncbi:MAG: DUF5305 family protein [Bacilli bacterium]
MPTKRRYGPLKMRFRLLFVAFIIIFISVGIISIIEANDIETLEDVIVFSYKGEPSFDYKVYYIENELYNEEYYGEGNLLISEFINNINLNFNYDFNISKKSDITYDYFIEGRLVGNYESSSDVNVFNEDKYVYKYYIEKKSEKDVSSISINKDINIDYNAYDNIVTNYKNQTNIPIMSYLEIKFNININGNVEDDDFNETSVTTLKIPLNQKAFSIAKTVASPISKTEIKTFDSEEVDQFKQNLGILLIVIGIALFILLFKRLFNIKPKNHYNTELNKILKSYGEVIIELVNGINEEGKDIVLVKEFNELLDLEEELRIPINFIETYPNYEGEFSIVHGKIIYKYILTNEE